MDKRRLTLPEFEAELFRIYREKKAKSRSFSIRAMASELGVPDTTLQKVFKGERNLGPRLAGEIAPRFNVDIVVEKKKRKPAHTKWAFKKLSEQSKTQISWVNLAILELIKLADFEPSKDWVAKKLGLPVDVVSNLLLEMENEGMLRREHGRWRDLFEDSSVHAERLLTSDVVRTELKKLMICSTKAIDTVPYEEREHSFSIFPVASSRLPALKRKIVDLRREFVQSAQASKGKKDALYVFQLGFFPVPEKQGE